MNQRGRLLAVDQGDASAFHQAARGDLPPHQWGNAHLFRLGYCDDLGGADQHQAISAHEAGDDLLAIRSLQAQS